MPPDPPGLLLNEPDKAVVEKLAAIERASLAIAAATVLISAIEWFMPGLRTAFPVSWRPLTGGTLLAAAVCGIAVFLAHPRFGRWVRDLSAALASTVALGCAAALLHRAFTAAAPNAGLGRTIELLRIHIPDGMSLQAELGFLCLGLMIVALRFDERWSVLTDAVSWLTGGIILSVTSAQMVAALPFFGARVKLYTSHQTMLCLFLLGFVAFARHARVGVFRMFLGRGIGSRVARTLAPIFVILPYFREGLRARLINFHRMPPHYITATLASAAVALSTLVLLYICWRFNRLEQEVQDLSLRDPLTDLYNLRGFRFLGEQVLRQARRTGQPFSLLFIDVDGLKQINDGLGHQAGSEFLVQTAEIMKETFRDADVMGRLGGDEFAVAGPFSEDAILHATDRLHDAATRRNASTEYEMPLSFSVGHVTSAPGSRDTLDELLASADEAMYQVKRRRKAEFALSTGFATVDSRRSGIPEP